MGDSLSTPLLEPGFRLGDRLALVLALWLIVYGSVRDRVGDGIEQTFNMPIAAGTWLGGNCSISSWACCLSAAITKIFYTATFDF